MRFALLTAFAVLICTAQDCYASDSTSLVSRISDFPNKFFNRVNRSTAELDNQLTNQTSKYLQKLAKREERLKKKLLQSDSNAAKILFANDVAGQYAMLARKLGNDSSRVVGSMGTEYLPYADSLQSSLAFLKTNPALVSSSKLVPSDIQKSLDQVRQLQAKMQDADQIKQFIQQRKQQLTQYFAQYKHLPPGVSGMLSDYKKQMYYYSEQVRIYRETLNDPDKMLKTALVLLNRVPSFVDFMKSNSFLAGLFSIPADYGSAAGLQGLQTRDQILALIQSQVGAGGANASSALQNSLQNASQDISKLHDKLDALGGGSGDMDIPGFKPNTQKTRTLLQRLEYGTNMQTTHANYYFPTTTDLGLSVAYKLDSKNSIGVGASYKVGWGSGFNHINLSSQGIGLRSFIDLQMKKSFYVSGGYEYNYQPATIALPVGLGSPWQQSGLVGLSKIVSMKTKVFKKTKIQLLWDFLSYQNVPRTQPILFRLGYSF